MTSSKIGSRAVRYRHARKALLASGHLYSALRSRWRRHGASFDLASRTPRRSSASPRPRTLYRCSSPSGFADLVARVKPAVHSVRVQMREARPHRQRRAGATVEWRPYGGRARRWTASSASSANRCQTACSERRRVQHNVEAEGSGFFISADGYAVTNNHVVDHAKTVQITTDDGTYPAGQGSRDRPQDRPGAHQDRQGRQQALHAVKFAVHEPRIGDWVITDGKSVRTSAAR